MESLTFHLERDPILGPIKPVDRRDLYQKYRSRFHIKTRPSKNHLLKQNSKLQLESDENIFAYGLTLAPATTSGLYDTCMWKTKGCENNCILDQSYQKSDGVRDSRRAIIRFLAEDAPRFAEHLAFEIEYLLEKHGENNVAIRLNVGSDIRWEFIFPSLIGQYSDVVEFYDYTKAPIKHRGLRDDYTLVFSVSERPQSVQSAAEYIRSGMSATVVLPIRYNNHNDMGEIDFLDHPLVVDHDSHDVRSLDKGKLGVLRAKGTGRSDTSGFVRDPKVVKEILDLVAAS